MITYEERQHLHNLLDEMLNDLTSHLNKSCVNCDHFNTSQELCGLVDERPPAKVIAQGCEQWVKEVPF